MAGNFMELGSTGLKRDYSGVMEEWQQELKYGKDIETYKVMSTGDPVIGAMLYAIEILLKGVTWNIRPADASSEAAADAEFVRECQHDMSTSWEDLISEILSMLAYGFSTHEIVYKRRDGVNSRFNDGRIGWRKLPIRSQDSIERFDFDSEGGVQAVRQRKPDDSGTVRIPIEKLLHFRTSTFKGNPYGRSVLRSAWRPYYFKRNIEDVEGIGIERDLAGLPVIYLPADYLTRDAPDDKRAVAEECRRIITNIRRDEQEGVLMPTMYDTMGNALFKLELLTSGGRRQFDTGAVIQRYNVQILVTVMADFILLGTQSQVGSYSLGETKSRLFTRSLNSYAQSIAAIFNRFGIPRLFALNGMSRASLPFMEPTELNEVSLTELGQFLSQTGIVLDDTLENHLRQRARMPLKNEPDGEEES